MIRFVFLITLLSPSILCEDLSDKEKMKFILGELANMKNKMADYETKMAKLIEINTNFETKLGELKDENNELRNRVNQLSESHEKSLKSAKETLDSSQQKMHNDVRSTLLRPTHFAKQRKSRQSDQINFGQVAFTAGISSSDQTGLGVHHTIIFDRTVSNIGGAYHAHTGIFTAPLKGVYVFSVTLMVTPRHSQYLELVVDGNLITDMLADAGDTEDYISTHKQWILEVNQGSEVWIRTSHSGEVHGGMHTLFSGFLLYVIE